MIIASSASANKNSSDELSEMLGIATLNAKPDSYPVLIHELNENALNHICTENHERAYVLLLAASSFLQKMNASSQIKNAAITVLTYHNLALCYQRFR